MVAIQNQDINTSNYKNCNLKDSNITNDTCRKCRWKSATFQHITDACRALIEVDYIHRHNEVTNVVRQELTLKRGLSNGPPVCITNMSHISATKLIICIITSL